MGAVSQVPLLKLFPGCQVQGRLRSAAEGCMVHHVVVHTSSHSVELEVDFARHQGEDVCERLERVLCRSYGFQRAALRPLAGEGERPVPVRVAVSPRAPLS